jgi:plastocyanin
MQYSKSILFFLPAVALAQYNYGSSGSSTSAAAQVESSTVTMASSPSSTSSSGTGTIQVQVGESGLKFTPNEITAAVGQEIEFFFHPADHSVVQSTFAAPCSPKAGGFFSTYQPVSSGTGKNSFKITVNNTTPIWFYCSQANHCNSGMVGSINAPSSGNTFQAFAQAATSASIQVPSESSPVGGILAATGSSSTGTSSTGTSTASGTASTASGAADILNAHSSQFAGSVVGALAMAVGWLMF